MKKLITSSSALWTGLIALVMMMASQSAWAEYVPLTALSGTGGTGGEGFASLVDQDINTKMGHSFDPSNPDRALAYIIVKAEKAVKPEWYFLVTGGDTGSYTGRNWKTWKIFGGNFANDADAVRGDLDDPAAKGWTLIDFKEDEPLPAANTTSVNLEFDYTGDETFQYFWIEILESVQGTDTWLQMGEWGLGSYGDFEKYLKDLANVGTGTDEPVNYFLIGGDPAGFGGEGVGNLIDGNTTNKWCTGFTNRTDTQEDPTANGGWIVFKASRSMAPTYYSLITGNDTGNSPGRNWKTWRIYGMDANDEADVVRNSDKWVLIDDKVNVPAGTGLNELPAANYAQAYFTLSENNTTAFRYFKVEIDACVNNGLMQMSELILGDEYTLAIDRNTLLEATAKRYNPDDFAEAALYDQMAELLANIQACTNPITLGELTSDVDNLVAKINASKNNYTDLVSARNSGVNQLADDNVKATAVEYVTGWISETDVIAPGADYPVGNFAYIKANRQLTGEEASAEAKRFNAFLQANVKKIDDPIGDVGYVFIDGCTDNWNNETESPRQLIDGLDGIDGRESTKWGTGTSTQDRFIIFKANQPIKPTYYGLVTGGDTGVYTDRNWKNWKIWAANFDEPIDELDPNDPAYKENSAALRKSDKWVLIDVKENVGTDVLKTTSLFESYINLSIGCSEPYEYFMIEVYHQGGMQMNEFTFYNQGDLEIYRESFVAEFENYDPEAEPAYKGYTDAYKSKYEEMCTTGYAPDLMKLRNELKDLQSLIASSVDKYLEYQMWFDELIGAGAASEDLQAWYDGYTGDNVAPNSMYINGTYAYIMENLQLDNDAIGVAAETYVDGDGKTQEVLPSGEIGYLQNMVNAAYDGVYILLGGNTVGQWGDGFYGHLIDGIALNTKDDEGNTINATKWGGSPDANGNTYIIFRTLDKCNPFFYTLTTGNDTGTYTGRNWGTWKIYGANFDGDADAKKDAEGWVLVDEKIKVGQDRLHPVNAEPSFFGFSTETTDEYTYYKVEVLEAYSGTQIQMNELHFGTLEEFKDLKDQYTLAAEEFDYDVVAEQALIDKYKEIVGDINDCENMEALFRVNYRLESLRDSITASAALYEKYNAKVEENKTYLEENKLTSSDALTIFVNYLEGDGGASELYPNGTAPYVLDQHVLADSVLLDEMDFMETLKANAVAAGYAPGIDVTSLIKNHTFAKAGEMLKDKDGNNVGREAEGWNGYIYRTNTNSSDNDIFAAEFCNENKTFDINQTLTELKNGFYKVTLNAGYRANGDAKMLSYNYAAIAYANDIATFVPVIREEAAETKEEAYTGNYGDKQIYSEDSTETFGWGIWGCEGAAHAFAQGRYAITMVAEVTDGTLTIGVKNEGSTLSGSNEWAAVGNFGLVYLGETDAADNGLAEALEEAANYNADRIKVLTGYDPEQDETAEANKFCYIPADANEDNATYATAPNFGAAQKATLAENSGIFTFEAEKVIGETMQSIYETKKAYLLLHEAADKVYDHWLNFTTNLGDLENAVYGAKDGLAVGSFDDAEAALAAKAQLYAEYPDYLQNAGSNRAAIDQENYTFSIETEGGRAYIDLKNLYEPLEENETILAFDYTAEQNLESGRLLYLTPNLMTEPVEDFATMPAASDWTTVYVNVKKGIKDLKFGSEIDHGIRWYFSYNATADDTFILQARNFRFVTSAQMKAAGGVPLNGAEGDLNSDNKVDIADAVTVLNIMASGEYNADADLNGDGKIDIADFVTVLNIMAAE